MSLIKTVLSKLFESALDKEEKENPDARPQVDEIKFSEILPDPASLQLPLGHPVNKLWDLWTEQAGRSPIPEFCLVCPEIMRYFLQSNWKENWFGYVCLLHLLQKSV